MFNKYIFIIIAVLAGTLIFSMQNKPGIFSCPGTDFTFECPIPSGVSCTKSDRPADEYMSQAVLANPQGIKYRFLLDPNLENKTGRNFVEFQTSEGFIKVEAPITDKEFWQNIANTFRLKQ